MRIPNAILRVQKPTEEEWIEHAMKHEEDESIEWVAGEAWVKYNPKWLLNNVDGSVRGESDFIYDVTEIREAYKAGFIAGMTYFITKEIPKEDK